MIMSLVINIVISLVGSLVINIILALIPTLVTFLKCIILTAIIPSSLSIGILIPFTQF